MDAEWVIGGVPAGAWVNTMGVMFARDMSNYLVHMIGTSRIISTCFGTDIEVIFVSTLT